VHILRRAPRRGGTWPVHGQAVERLGALGGRPAVDALEDVLAARSFRAPFKMAALHRLAVENLARVGTPEAVSALESAAAYGPRWIRKAARARLNASRRGDAE
jgi:HEAT repeat protein